MAHYTNHWSWRCQRVQNASDWKHKMLLLRVLSPYITGRYFCRHEGLRDCIFYIIRCVD